MAPRGVMRPGTPIDHGRRIPDRRAIRCALSGMITRLIWGMGLLGILLGAVGACSNDPGASSPSQEPMGGSAGTDNVGSSGGPVAAAGASATGGGGQGPSGMGGTAKTMDASTGPDANPG